ncbi:pantothenate transporter liz1 [Colletotrichum liriopes]|uniref:Pantothenate transporter liz1 n=1 Tax=Colletotrichum liriopes TaxID=708192 RepID=A0AA37GT87_9PEZI|nr:pantothenate transporter liz1 [Colletotrichum liriopes]
MSPLSDLRQHFKGAPSTQEKRLVLKLDFFILTFCCLAYFIITQAYVSGMKEDLGFEGAQLTEVTTLYATAYLMSVN